jgi:hypothetical protein
MAIDHVCYDGSLHGGGRLFANLCPVRSGIECNPSVPEPDEVSAVRSRAIRFKA